MLVAIKLSLILTLIIASSWHYLAETKVLERCELAKILREHHRLNSTEVAIWVCIAQHSSGLNTTAHAYSISGSSHGLFQISDAYWCSPSGQGAGCNLHCQKLRDDDLSDDISCIKHIYNEHQRISGDGYNAWNAYQQNCKHNAASYTQNCFPVDYKETRFFSSDKGYHRNREQFSRNAIPEYYTPKKSGKVYERCELARELHNKHKMPMQQIPTWVCIAEHESHFNTAALGRLNTDDSIDHGLFQISDLFWCSHDRYPGGGKACGLSCSKLLDNDITDDVNCVKKIHSEHTALSGDGFTAWTVYKPFCQNQVYEQIANCFNNTQKAHRKINTYSLQLATNQIQTTAKFPNNKSNPFLKNVIQQLPAKSYNNPTNYNPPNSSASNNQYTRCSLAQELYFKHNFPLQDIPTWVCIAEHESQFNTAAVGRVNTDGSADYGIFQINDRYWCDHSLHGGKACNLSCDKLLDDDIDDDVTCIKAIHKEHSIISGDGFNAWAVYKPHCQSQNIENIKNCFDEKVFRSFEITETSPSFNREVINGKGKIFSKCELAQELFYKHDIPIGQIPKWVCIAYHESSLNTAALGRLNADGSADYGLFQISDLYWCTHDKYGGKACNIPCDKLLDSDITDDVRCIKIIHEEHTRISGDGFNAWTVYKPHCRNAGLNQVKKCFTEKEFEKAEASSISNSFIPRNSFELKQGKKGKVYEKCELAQELYYKHGLPIEQIPKWVCIAQHESSLNTAALGRLNTDGSADHGLFQISDLYWCTHDKSGGKACNIPCDKLLDSDITDDVRCIKIIHEEHTRISGDGFNAWTVYKPHCRNAKMRHVKECFQDNELPTNSIQPLNTQSRENAKTGKIYKKCELALELIIKYKIPIDQVPTWICIAQHESSFNTAAVGRLNADGSLDHGLFQISDLYWCSHDQYNGKGCNIPCNKLLDSEIEDDIECVKIIHEEHTRISGDGFNAWTIYKQHCKNRKIEEITSCLSNAQMENLQLNESVFKEYNNKNSLQNTLTRGFGQNFINNNYFNFNYHDEQPKYINPFLQDSRIASASQVHEVIVRVSNNSNDINKESYKQNPFLSRFLNSSSPSKNDLQFKTPTTSNYSENIFMKNVFSSTVGNEFIIKPVEMKNEPGYLKNKQTELSNPIKPSRNSLQYKPSTVDKNEKYLNSNDFRTTTSKPKITAVKPPKTSSVNYVTQSTTKTSSKATATIKTKRPVTFHTFKASSAALKNSSDANTFTTALTKTTFTSSWQNQKSKNQKIFNSTTTKQPNTTILKQRESTQYKALTTIKPTNKTTAKSAESQKHTHNSTLAKGDTNRNSLQRKNIKSSLTTTIKPERTTWTWKNFQKSTTIQPLTTTENWRKWDRPTIPSTTTRKAEKNSWNLRNEQISSTTKNWRQWDEISIKNHSTTTARPVRTTWNWRNEQKSSTTENWRKWDKIATKTTSTTTVRPEGTTWNWRNAQKSSTTENWRKWDKIATKNTSTTTVRPERTTWNWKKEQKSSTTEKWRKSDKISTRNSSTATARPERTTWNWRNEQISYATENWRKWDKITTRTTSTTTVRPEGTTWNWRNAQKSSTTENWRKYDKTTTIWNWRSVKNSTTVNGSSTKNLN